jgi:hypothetical protein
LYCVSEALLDVLKFELWFVIADLDFPSDQWFSFVLGSDAACTNLSDHSARKCALLDLVCCYKPTGDREQDLWTFWQPDCCIKQGYDKPMVDFGLCKKWAEGGMKQWHSCILYCIEGHWYTVCEHTFQKHSWFTPLTTLSIQTTENYLLALVFLRSVSILSSCSIINIRCCHQNRKLFHYFKLLT